jgi:hypothetical protein
MAKVQSKKVYSGPIGCDDGVVETWAEGEIREVRDEQMPLVRSKPGHFVVLEESKPKPKPKPKPAPKPAPKVAQQPPKPPSPPKAPAAPPPVAPPVSKKAEELPVLDLTLATKPQTPEEDKVRVVYEGSVRTRYAGHNIDPGQTVVVPKKDLEHLLKHNFRSE